MNYMNGYDFPMTQGRVLPNITLREIDLPEVKSWVVGGKYFLTVQVEMTGQRTMKNLDAPNLDRNKIEGDFQILSLKMLDPEATKQEEQKAWEETVARNLSGAK
jgi:hypothetical protein